MSRIACESAPDQSGRVVLITGGNGGIGLEAARLLMRAGARVVLACRDLQRGEAAVQALREAGGAGSVSVLQLDLSNLSSVRAAVSRFADTHDQLDVLVNNAGVMALPRALTADGFEMQLGVNHFGHFALTGLLLAREFRAPIARIVTVSSLMHFMGKLDFDDLDGARKYDRWKAYAGSKLANVLFSLELARRLKARGLPTLSVGCHPGYSTTNLSYVGPTLRGSRLGLAMHRVGHSMFAQSAQAGAAPTVFAATAPDVQSGDFIGPDGPFEVRGAPTKRRSSATSRDPELAARLWRVSVERTSVAYERLDPA